MFIVIDDSITEPSAVQRLTAAGVLESIVFGPLAILALTCTAEERTTLAQLPSDTIDRLEREAARICGMPASAAGFRIAVAGGGSTIHDLQFLDPELSAEWTRHVLGTWLWPARLAAVRFTPRVAVAELIAHELAHGLLDQMSGCFPYPRAIGEGVARLLGLRVAGGDRARVWGVKLRGSLPRGLPEPSYMSLRTLFEYRPKPDALTGLIDMDAERRMFGASPWLVVFLSRLRNGRGALLPQLLRRLKDTNTRAPGDAIACLEELAGPDAMFLEERFRRYRIQPERFVFPDPGRGCDA